MPIPNRREVGRHHRLAVLLLLGACQSEPAAPPRMDQPVSRLKVIDLPASTPSLCEVRRWLDPAGRFLVAPRWTPDGMGLWLHGRWGLGLYLFEPRSGDLFSQAPEDLRARPPGDPPAESWLQDGVASAAILHEDEGGRALFESRRGRIAWVEGATERVLVATGAWGVAASPDGQRIAYCLGPLGSSHVWVAWRSGERRDFGPGAQPVWLDATSLVYAVPLAERQDPWLPVPNGADLFLLDVQSDRVWPLTHVSEFIQMNPAVFPPDRLAWSDWRSGALLTGRICNRVEAP